MRNMPFYAKTYSLTSELNKLNFLNKKTFTHDESLKLKSILKKDLDITMRELPEKTKISVLNSMDLSFFYKNKCL